MEIAIWRLGAFGKYVTTKSLIMYFQTLVGARFPLLAVAPTHRTVLESEK
uniref:Uncharacterized protein n=1 Tax=Aegilops tauschii subsp. strangulata TaxID=200361 RepID=A0A453J4E7_AEGTS